ncbi:MAG: hypothetical protein PWQ63_238 [Methanolobus sp.]|jgi:hypothetical protein|nr:hypothetical protein [Methanolobus sp.]
MENIAVEVLNSVQLNGITEFRNMAVAPISYDSEITAEYLTLKEALEAGTLSIQETDVHGSVPELAAANTGHLPVLILDGEELAGAKQNRAVNTTIMIAPFSKVNIPVSCTEQGRWRYNSKAFMDSDVVMSHRTRRNRSESVTENLVNFGGFSSNQHQVWENIREEAMCADVSSPTGAMSDTFKQLRPKLDDYVGAFPVSDGQRGFVVFINGKPVGMEMISRHDKYALLHAKLIRSYATEAIYCKEKNGNLSAEQAEKFITEASMCTYKGYPSVGLGEDFRFTGSNMAGSALVVDNALVHCAFFKKEQDNSRQYREADGMMDSRSRRESRFRSRIIDGDIVF